MNWLTDDRLSLLDAAIAWFVARGIWDGVRVLSTRLRADHVPSAPRDPTLGYGHTDPQATCRACKNGPPVREGQVAPHRVAPLRIRPASSPVVGGPRETDDE